MFQPSPKLDLVGWPIVHVFSLIRCVPVALLTGFQLVAGRSSSWQCTEGDIDRKLAPV